MKHTLPKDPSLANPIISAEADTPEATGTMAPKGKFATHVAGMYGNIAHTPDLPDVLVGKTINRAYKDLNKAGCSIHTLQALIQSGCYQEAADHYFTFMTLMKGQQILMKIRDANQDL